MTIKLFKVEGNGGGNMNSYEKKKIESNYGHNILQFKYFDSNFSFLFPAI